MLVGEVVTLLPSNTLVHQRHILVPCEPYVDVLLRRTVLLLSTGHDLLQQQQHQVLVPCDFRGAGGLLDHQHALVSWSTHGACR
jgi:hypothetical protein